MLREIDGSVVVILGASSGVGRTTAELFADHGAKVVLAARSRKPLEDVAAAVRAKGAEALVVPTDVGDLEQVQALADAAVATFGRVDTWVNTAAVLVAGVFGEESPDEVERLVRTNVIGNVWSARVALDLFRRQEQGVLVDVASVLGLVPNPLVPLYTMSKFGVRGLSLSLHHLSSAFPGVRVCVVCPGPIDTPMFGRAGNHTGRELRAIPPALAPERVAAAIVSCARRPRRQVVVGAAGKTIVAAQRLSPRIVEWLVARGAATLLTRPTTEQDERGGEVVEGGAGGAETGHYRQGRLRRRAGAAVGRIAAGV